VRGLIAPGQRVMVGKGEQLDLAFRGERRELGGMQAAVGIDAMRMQINALEGGL